MAPDRTPRTLSLRNLADIVRQVRESFLGRCLTSFANLQGVDRSMVLASQAFTALIPLLILSSALAPVGSSATVADALIRRFDLAGDSADSVTALFASTGDGSTGVLSVVLLVFSGLSLTRRMQGTYLLAWRLAPVPGVRASLSALLGLATLVVEISLLALARTFLRGLPFDGVLAVLLSFAGGVVLWTTVPWLLLDRRLGWRRLLPGGVLTAVATSLYSFATTIYMPRLIATYSERYGLFGITLAMVGWLLAVSVIVVAAAVVAAELDRAPDPWARRLRLRLLPQG